MWVQLLLVKYDEFVQCSDSLLLLRVRTHVRVTALLSSQPSTRADLAAAARTRFLGWLCIFAHVRTRMRITAQPENLVRAETFIKEGEGAQGAYLVAATDVPHREVILLVLQ